jgi:hypothetical protein
MDFQCQELLLIIEAAKADFNRAAGNAVVISPGQL